MSLYKLYKFEESPKLSWLPPEPPSCPAGMNPTATTTLQYPPPPAPVRPAALKMARVIRLKRRNLVSHPDGEAKFWLTPSIELARNIGLSSTKLGQAERLVRFGR